MTVVSLFTILSTSLQLTSLTKDWITLLGPARGYTIHLTSNNCKDMRGLIFQCRVLIIHSNKADIKFTDGTVENYVDGNLTGKEDTISY